MKVRYFSGSFTISLKLCRGLCKISLWAKVPDKHSVITVICLLCLGVDYACPDKAKGE